MSIEDTEMELLERPSVAPSRRHSRHAVTSQLPNGTAVGSVRNFVYRA
jgi:hypothetical protein